MTESTESQKQHLYRCLFIAAVLLVAYCNIFNHGFVWDDALIIADNPLLERLGNLPRLFLSEDRIDLVASGYYRPVTYASFLIERSLWGLNPLGYDLTNLALQIAVACSFYFVVLRLFKKEWHAFAAALIFALNPIANETVNFHAGGRNTLLCALFALLTLLFHARRNFVLSSLFFLLAIFSKEFALLMPVILFAYDRLLAEDKQPLTRYLPYAAGAVGYLVIRSFAVASANFLRTLQLKNLWLLTPRLLADYLGNMLLPFRLKTMYDLSPAERFGEMLPYLAVLLAVIAVAVWFRKRREVVFSVGWFFLFMLPVSGLLPLGMAQMADRYAYFSAMGFAMALGWLITLADRKIAVALLAGLCLWYGASDLQRNAYWENEVSLFSQMIQDVPTKSIGYQDLSFAYYQLGDYDKATKYLFDACYKATDGKVKVTRLTEILWEMGKFDQAIEVNNEKIAEEPNNPHPYMMLSRIYGDLGDRAKEQSCRAKALELFPGTEGVMTERATEEWREGQKYLAEHRLRMAKQRFQDALNIDLNFVPALVSLGVMSKEAGDLPDADRFLEKAALLEPANGEARRNLEEVHRLQGRDRRG